MNRFLTVCLLVVLGPGLARLNADVITMKDGRRFEGQVLSTGDTVAIDALVAGIRVTLTLKSADIQELERKPLPDRFFDGPAADQRVSDPAQMQIHDNLYLEVPVRGVFGKDFHREALRRSLAYARQHGIRHVVFSIDSDGGDLDEAGAMAKMLDAHADTLTFHAVITRCLDDAMVFAIRSHTLHMRAGADVGGTGRKLSEISDKISADEEDILRSQIARKASELARKRGRGGLVIQAMIDPHVSLAAWLNAEGYLDMGEAAPADVPADRVIFRVGDGELLRLNEKQLRMAKAPELKGTVAELGTLLKIEDWKAESNYAEKTVMQVAANETARADAAARVFESRVSKNVSRREETEQYISHNLSQAAKWDPNKANYQTYSQRWNWGNWGWGYGESADYMTKEARKTWKERTDACVGYLQRTVKGMITAKKLDKEAESLGLKPTYKPGELDNMLDDLKVKLNTLASNRNNREPPSR